MLVQRGEVERGDACEIEGAVQGLFVPDVSGKIRSGTLMRKRRRSVKTRFVICLDNRGYEVSLERGKLYAVLPDREAIKHQFIRVVDESGEDYLFPTRMFRLKSSS
jgi:hypothetical protein